MPFSAYKASSSVRASIARAESSPPHWQTRRRSYAARNPQQLLDLILEITTEGIFGVDAGGCCTFVNDAAASMLGCAPDRLLGTHILERIHVSADDSRFVRGDSSSFPIRVFSYPWIEDDDVNGAIYVFQDLTATQRLDRELNEARRRHCELFDYVTSGVFQTSPEGELLAANPALIQLLGFESENELRALDVRCLYQDPEQRKQFTAELERDGFLRNVVLTLRRKDGSIMRVVENSRAVRAEDGRVIYYEGTLNPLSE